VVGAADAHCLVGPSCCAAGLELRLSGSFKPGAKLIVANHVSWLDIIAIHSVCPQARFVSKAEVKDLAVAEPAGCGRRHAVHRA
jgi:1-acyl-sn-glycerol-3-phosphate acyltransferase